MIEQDVFDSASDRRRVVRAVRDDVPLPASQMVYAENRGYAKIRRLVDVPVSLLLLVLSAPLMLLATAAIVLEDGWPAIFEQKRVGQYEKLFTIYKMRTMKRNMCGDLLSPSTGCDRRLTRVGAFLRKYSIDELPQLINVLRGDMTLVGPRPEMPFVVSRYAAWQHLRHLAKPGITGLWQVRCRSTIPLHRPEATILDLEYIHRSSTTTDVTILVQTVGAVLGKRGAY